jgi:hypothetical protein
MWSVQGWLGVSVFHGPRRAGLRGSLHCIGPFFLGAYTAAFVLVFILHDDQRPDCLCIKWAKRPRCPSLPMSLLVGVTVFNIADMVVVASCVADLRMPDYLIMAVISPLPRVTLALSSTSTLLAPRASCKLRTSLPSRPDI